MFLTDYLIGTETENAFGRGIPEANQPGGISGHDGILSRIHYQAISFLGFLQNTLSPIPLGHIDEYPHQSAHLAMHIGVCRLVE